MKKLITAVLFFALSLAAIPAVAAPVCPDGQVWDGKQCVYIATGGIMPFMGRPAINPWFAPIVSVSGKKATVSFLATQFGQGELLVSPKNPMLFLDSYQQVTNPENLAGLRSVIEPIDYAKYKDGTTYHTLTVELSVGTWYLTPVSTVRFYRSFGQPLVVEIK